MSASRAKGTGAETAVVNYLRDNGWPHAERRAQSGTHDRGDIAGVIGTVIEVKNCARMELAQWVDEAEVEAGNDNADLGVVWHKRRGKGSPADWFVTMDGATFTWLLRAALDVDERIADEEIARGDVHRFGDVEEAIGWLRAPDDQEPSLAARLAANDTTVQAELDQAFRNHIIEEMRRG